MIKRIPARPGTQADSSASLARDTHAKFVKCRERNQTVQGVRKVLMARSRLRFEREAFMSQVWAGLAKN